MAKFIQRKCNNKKSNKTVSSSVLYIFIDYQTNWFRNCQKNECIQANVNILSSSRVDDDRKKCFIQKQKIFIYLLVSLRMTSFVKLKLFTNAFFHDVDTHNWLLFLCFDTVLYTANRHYVRLIHCCCLYT